MINATIVPIPDKLYFSIGETSQLCQLKPHVLRYWEQEFSQLKPTTRRGGRRYYQRKDVELIQYIRDLLYNRGFTIAGAKKQLKAPEAKDEIQVIRQEVEHVKASAQNNKKIAEIIYELEKLLISLN